MMQSDVLRDLDIQDVLERVSHEAAKDFGKGKVASYIPALKRVPKRKFAMSVCTVDGQEYSVGSSDEAFSIQSISKVLTLAMALEELGAGLWKRVGREPSGNPFNSLVQLERENGIPRNPFINAGALVVTDVLT